MTRHLIATFALALVTANAFADTATLKQSLAGDWIVQSCEQNGRELRTTTKIAKLTITDDLLLLFDAANDKRELKYELLNGENGWAIDLYADYGPMKGLLIPSRVSVTDGKLTLLFPANADARRSRPDSIASAGHPDWVVLHLVRADTPNP